MQIYRLLPYYQKGSIGRSYHGPPKLVEFYDDPARPVRLWKALFLYKYLKLQPQQFAEENLVIHKELSDRPYDIESVMLDNIWCVSERFKTFMEAEEIPLDYFSVKAQNEQRYLMMWRKLPIISEYEVDTEKSGYVGSAKKLDYSRIVFRSDLLRHFNYRVFSMPLYMDIYIIDELREAFQQHNFSVNYGYREDKPFPVTEINSNPSKLKSVLQKAQEQERKTRLTDWYYERMQEVDEYLEKVLIQENKPDILAKFQREMKGVWKKDFERYAQNDLGPLEKINYW